MRLRVWWRIEPPRLNLPGNHALPSDDSDIIHYQFEFELLTRPQSKNREMQGDDDFQPFFRLIASTVGTGNSRLRTRNAKTLLEPTCKQSMLKPPVWNAIPWNRAIKNSCKDHLNCELVDAGRMTGACIIVMGYRMHANRMPCPMLSHMCSVKWSANYGRGIRILFSPFGLLGCWSQINHRIIIQ